MRVASIKVKSRVLAERFGWPVSVAEGYVDGEAFRRRKRDPLPPYLLVGVDEYAQGFRAAYFGRRPFPTTLSGRPTAPAE